MFVSSIASAGKQTVVLSRSLPCAVIYYFVSFLTCQQRLLCQRYNFTLPSTIVHVTEEEWRTSRKSVALRQHVTESQVHAHMFYVSCFSNIR